MPCFRPTDLHFEFLFRIHCAEQVRFWWQAGSLGGRLAREECHKCYITLNCEGCFEKLAFLLYNTWTASNINDVASPHVLPQSRCVRCLCLQLRSPIHCGSAAQALLSSFAFSSLPRRSHSPTSAAASVTEASQLRRFCCKSGGYTRYNLRLVVA